MPIPTDELVGRTVMVMGGPGTGKTAHARDLVGQLAEGPGRVALVSTDMGQQSLGVPTCLSLSIDKPHDQASTMYFIGDVTPQGSLLQTVVGTSRLVNRARVDGAETVVVDTAGMIEKEVGRVLKYHEAVAAGADCVVALQRATELEAILGLLGGICPHVYREPVAADAKDRKLGQRREFRKKRYQAYFANGESLKFDASRMIGVDWAPDPLKRHQFPEPGTLVGLLDDRDFCLGIGVVEKILPGHVVVFSPPCDRESVARLKIGKIRLDREKGCVELRLEPTPQGA